MKNQFTKCLFSAGLIVLFSGICSYAFSQNTTGPVRLTYNYPADKAIVYSGTSTMAQIMDIQGQSMQVDVNSAFGCSVKSAGKQDDNLKIEITVDTLGQTTNSPMGNSGGAITDIKGKTCTVIISPEGKVIDLSGAAGLVYSMEGSGETNLSQTFSDFFPVLPQKAVATGDIWNSTDSMTTKTPAMTMKTIDNTINKVEGFETVSGIECAKISTQHSGTISMNVQNQGNDLFIKGPFTGTSEYLFAVKEGYFIKMTSATKVNGNLDMTSPQEMSFPIVLDMKSVNEVRPMSVYSQSSGFYDFKVKTLEGDDFDLASLKGKKVMVVNVASKCGFTPQYKDLEELYRKYEGELVIIGFPANNFLSQEPGTASEIRQFCTQNYGVTFPMMEKISVKGHDMHPLYKWLTSRDKNGVMDSEVKWNFQKYLIDENGKLVDVLYSKEKPESEKTIKWLSAK